MSENVLSAEALRDKLRDVEIYYYPSIDSTNNQAKRLIEEGRKEKMLIVADEQTAGRGRQGKSFYSPKSTGIYMSFVIHPDKELSAAVSSTCAASVAVCRAIESLTDKRPEIKWVNDIFLGGRKICGILCEAINDSKTQRISSIIIGIGININTKSFPKGIKAANLEADISKEKLIAEIVRELERVAESGFESFIDYYRSHSMIIGKEIVFIRNGVSQNAKAIGIENDGALKVELENREIITLRSGEITIRRL